jgi:RNA polymerase sigma-70 factor (ECF subfamily)
MPDSERTRWTVILGAARGEAAARAEFARRYEPIVRAYLGARWRASPLRAEMDDAAQEVFLACFRDDGALTRADPDRPAGFRPFLHGVVRNVARRFEERWTLSARRADREHDIEAVEADEETLSRAFDRAWAVALLRQALDLQVESAAGDADALRRVELLRLRFRDGLPIRDIAARWNEDPTALHTAYARARREFRRALGEIVGRLHPEGDVDAECARLVEHFR